VTAGSLGSFSAPRNDLRVVALAGGVGGAKLVQGLAHLLPPASLRVIVNTGDDFEHLGLTVCPDLDTVTYTLAGVANPATGWGLRDETFNCLASMERLGGPTWFRLGDHDLATHLLRTARLKAGARLTAVTADLAAALGVEHAVLPMSDEPFRTYVITDEGELPFQVYFVQRHWEPRVREIYWLGDARPSPEVINALSWADVIVICPSNPFVSIDPILALPGVRAAVSALPAVAVSPILGGEVVKGPAAKISRELGIPPTATAVAEHYRDLLTGFVLDDVDAALAPDVRSLGLDAHVMDTMMPGPAERMAVARGVLTFAATLVS
jgi:LPPG:FO 2-phospho-L-lactate transferase